MSVMGLEEGARWVEARVAVMLMMREAESGLIVLSPLGKRLLGPQRQHMDALAVRLFHERCAMSAQRRVGKDWCSCYFG